VEEVNGLTWGGVRRMIEDFQRGEVDTYVRHIRAGVEALSQDRESLLVFSGWVSSQSPPLSATRTIANKSLVVKQRALQGLSVKLKATT